MNLLEYFIQFDILITLCNYRTSPTGHKLRPLDDGDGDGDEDGRLLVQAVLPVGSVAGHKIVLVTSELSTTEGFSCKKYIFISLIIVIIDIDHFAD